MEQAQTDKNTLEATLLGWGSQLVTSDLGVFLAKELSKMVHINSLFRTGIQQLYHVSNIQQN